MAERLRLTSPELFDELRRLEVFPHAAHRNHLYLSIPN